MLAVHAALFLLVLFGWTAPSLWYLYMSALALTLLSDLVFGYCILSKWEFDLRKRANPNIRYNYHWTSYYTYRLTERHLSDMFFTRASILFLIASLGINGYFHFLLT